MRKFTLFMMFSLACFSLYGQTAREPKIYVTPIEGLGKEADNDYLYKRLNYEIILQNHKTVKSIHESDYTFRGTIGLASEVSNDGSGNLEVKQLDIESPIPKNPYPPVRNDFGRREFFSTENGNKYFFYDSSGMNNSLGTTAPQEDDQENYKEFYLKIDMIDSVSGEGISKQIFIFVNTDASVDKLVSTAVTALFSAIPDPSSKRGDSRNRWLYFSASALWMPSFFINNLDTVNLLNLGLDLGIEFHFIKLLSFCTGARLFYEQFDPKYDNVADLTLGVPASIKATFYLKDKFELAPYLGVVWNNSLLKTIEPSKFSGFVGVQFGIKDNKEFGLFVFDAGLSIDFSKSVNVDSGIENQRFNAFLGAGYKFGILQRKDNIK